MRRARGKLDQGTMFLGLFGQEWFREVDGALGRFEATAGSP
jgi:hypothetical protein